MKDRKLKTNCLLLCLLIGFNAGIAPSWAQPSVTEDLQKISRVYSGLANWSANLTYYVYANPICSNPQSTEQGLYMKRGKCEYLKVSTVETYTMESCRIILDQEAKTMMVFPPADKPLNPLRLEEALSICEKTVSIETPKGERGYFFMFKKNASDEMAGISIFFNARTSFIRKLILYYKVNEMNDPDLTDQPRMEVSYFNYKVNGAMREDFFNASRFFTGKGKGIKVSKEFSDFNVTDCR